MQESYGEGVANHTGPELCVANRKAGHEALVGVRAGQVLSPESTHEWGADAVPLCGRQHSDHRQREMVGDPAGSQTLSMHGSSTHANREIPSFVHRSDRQGVERSGKSEDVRR
jgi:RNA-directed DNA polymerase